MQESPEFNARNNAENTVFVADGLQLHPLLAEHLAQSQDGSWAVLSQIDHIVALEQETGCD